MTLPTRSSIKESVEQQDELRPERALAAPLWWIALLILVVNDHLLKDLVGGALTGKLSDFFGLIVAPPLFAAIVRAKRRRLVAGCFALTGAVFAAIKLSPELARGWEGLAALVGIRWSVVCDPTDLLALPMLIVSWRALVPHMTDPLDIRRSLERAGMVAGALACMATSAARPPEPVPMPGKVAALGWPGDPVFVIDVRTGERSVRIDPEDDVNAAVARTGMLFLLEDERLVSLSPYGKALHARPLGDADVHPLLLADDARLFVVQRAPSDGGTETVVAYAQRDLKRAWSRPIAKGKVSRFPTEYPSVGGGLVVMTLGKELVAVDAVSGRLMWRHRSQAELLWPHAAPRGVFVTDGDSVVFRLDSETGKELWRRRFAKGGFEDRYYQGAPLASAKGLLLVSDKKSLSAVDPETGQVRWTRRNVIDAAIGDTIAVARLDKPERTLLAVGVEDGRQRWRVTTDEDVSVISPPVIANDDAIVLVRPHQEELFGYDAASGKLLWRFDLDDGERVTEVGGVALVRRVARR